MAMSLNNIVPDPSACPLVAMAAEQNKALLGGSQNHPEACCVALMKIHFTRLCVNTGLRLVFSFPLETRPGKGPQTHPLMSKLMRSANS